MFTKKPVVLRLKSHLISRWSGLRYFRLTDIFLGVTDAGRLLVLCMHYSLVSFTLPGFTIHNVYVSSKGYENIATSIPVITWKFTSWASFTLLYKNHRFLFVSFVLFFFNIVVYQFHVWLWRVLGEFNIHWPCCCFRNASALFFFFR